MVAETPGDSFHDAEVDYVALRSQVSLRGDLYSFVVTVLGFPEPLVGD
jgi:hypothetical protein